MRTSAFLHNVPLGGRLRVRATGSGLCQNCVKPRHLRVRSRARILACTEASPNASEVGLSLTWESLKEKPMLWAEVPFNSLQEELNAIDDYQKDEQIEDNASWPHFLRAAAYEHWGQPKLALAELDVIDFRRGFGLIPDFWLRRAYNAFKVGNLRDANEFHDEAERVSVDAVGNQLHFSFWFEQHFKDFKPKHNGPTFTLQHGICKYCMGVPKNARQSIAPHVAARDGDERDLQHAAMWYLAASSRWHLDDNLKTDSRDLEVVQPILVDSNLSPELVPIASLFLGKPSGDAVKAAEASVHEEGLDVGIAMNRALYLALYYDAFENDSKVRDKWLDIAVDSPHGTCTNDLDDFLYHTAKNRLGKIDKNDA